MTKKILFLTLKVFSATGGIEKVCRVAGKAMHDSGNVLSVFSMYDAPSDAGCNAYFPSAIFRGFDKSRIRFMFASVRAGLKMDTVVLSHINLLPAGFLIKLFSPSTTLILFAHGIEIWRSLSAFKTRMLKKCDRIFSVSHYTANIIQQQHSIAASRLKVLNNCLDPFLTLPETATNNSIRNKYNIEGPFLFTLTRLAATERHKGYDKVIRLLPALKKKYPGIRYMIAGKYKEDEKNYLQQLAASLMVQDHVIITGFVPDIELAGYFKAADLYIAPSKKEGFGIVFIEAMYYGLPVIAGNRDGSVDALMNGKLGLLVDPDDTAAIQQAIEKIAQDKTAYAPDRSLLLSQFGYETYKNNLQALLQEPNSL